MIMKGMVDMKYNIRGDKIVATKAIKDYVQDKLGRLDKYFKESDEYTANVLIRVKGHKQTIEVTVPTNKFILRSEVTDEDLYAAIDIVCDKLERQIRKNKTRLKKKSVLDNYKELGFEEDDILVECVLCGYMLATAQDIYDTLDEIEYYLIQKVIIFPIQKTNRLI